MSVKRALSVLAFAIASGGVGSAVIVGTSASGATSPEAALPAAPAPAAAPVTTTPHFEAMPKTALHLPSTLKLLNRTVGARRLDTTHSIFSAALSKQGHKRVIGSAAYSCVAVSGSYQQDCRGALVLRNGALLVHQVLDVRSHQITGEVTGGSGFYEGAQGSVTGRDLGGGRDRLTIHYAFEQLAEAGYSGTPLAKKLGATGVSRCLVVGPAPEAVLSALPSVAAIDDVWSGLRFVHRRTPA